MTPPPSLEMEKIILRCFYKLRVDQRLSGQVRNSQPNSVQTVQQLPSPRQSENLLLNAQKELEVLLKVDL